MRVAFLVGRREWKTRTWRLFWLAALEIVFFVTRAPLFVLRLKLFRPSNHVLAENRGVPVTPAVLSGVGAVGSGSLKKQAAELAGGSKAFLPRVLPPSLLFWRQGLGWGLAGLCVHIKWASFRLVLMLLLISHCRSPWSKGGASLYSRSRMSY